MGNNYSIYFRDCIGSVFYGEMGYVYGAKAFYEFWTIPDYYIESSNENTVFDFLLVLVAVIVFMFISYIYLWCFRKNKKEKKYINLIVQIFFVPFLLYVALMILMNMDGNSWWTLLILTFTGGHKLLFYTMPLTLVIYLLGYGAAMSVVMILEMADSIKNVKLSELNGRKVMLMLSFIFILWIILCSSIYSSKVSSCETGKELEIVDVGGTQYVVIVQYQDKWIVKECILKDATVFINKDNYSCIEISGFPIRHFENSIENVAALISYDEFEKMK